MKRTQTFSPYTRDELGEVSRALGESTTDHVKQPLTNNHHYKLYVVK